MDFLQLSEVTAQPSFTNFAALKKLDPVIFTFFNQDGFLWLTVLAGWGDHVSIRLGMEEPRIYNGCAVTHKCTPTQNWKDPLKILKAYLDQGKSEHQDSLGIMVHAFTGTDPLFQLDTRDLEWSCLLPFTSDDEGRRNLQDFGIFNMYGKGFLCATNGHILGGFILPDEIQGVHAQNGHHISRIPAMLGIHGAFNIYAPGVYSFMDFPDLNVQIRYETQRFPNIPGVVPRDDLEGPMPLKVNRDILHQLFDVLKEYKLTRGVQAIQITGNGDTLVIEYTDDVGLEGKKSFKPYGSDSLISGDMEGRRIHLNLAYVQPILQRFFAKQSVDCTLDAQKVTFRTTDRLAIIMGMRGD